MRKGLVVLLALMLLVSFASVPASASGTYNFTVVFKSATLPANAAAIAQNAGATVVSSIPELGIMTVSGPGSLMDTLNADTAIKSASPSVAWQLPAEQSVEYTEDSVSTANADLYNRYQWDIKQITNNGASYALGTGSHNTVVGVIDTGVSTQHPALKANLLGGRNFVPAGANGDPTETGNPADIEDRHGHGSHTAGNVAGNGRIMGIAPNVGFRSYRVFGATGGAPTDWIAGAMVAATNDGVDVITMSIGGYDSITPYTWTDPATGTVYKGQDVADFLAWRRAVQYAVNHGVVVVAAAGNENIDTANPTAVTAYLNAEYGSLGYAFSGASREVPGTTAGVVTVSATGPDKTKPSYSNYGPGAIDLSAPGGDFQRYPAAGWFTDMNLSSYKHGGYVWMAGTSMATPKVAAVAALIIDQAKANGQKITPAQVVAKLQKTAVDLGKPGYDEFFGYGMANAYNALGGK